ncbi:hypothetical protein [Streptomyces albofaciens]|uniref:hypothetical protein n=1 Tax=Streptomyces albofaciens TaxID=66866 RepID=UPI00142F0050|nr:hypothetical protein [Streptomyces albofaciens]
MAAEEINLPNLISHLEVNLQNTSGVIADAARQGSSVGAALGSSLQEVLRAQLADLPEVELDADSSELDRDLVRVRRDLQRLADERIGVDISIEDALRRMAELEPHLERLSQQHPSIVVRGVIGGALADFAEVREAARAVDGTDIEIDAHVDTHNSEATTERLRGALSRLGAMGSTIAGLGASFFKVSAAVGAVMPLVGGLAATLASIAPAAGVGATGLLALVTLVGTIKIALSGVGEAIKAAFDPSKPEAYAEALKKLSPNARSFVQQIRSMSPELDKIKRSVQDRVFAGLDTQLKATAASTLPVFRQALTSSATTLNQMASGVLTTARHLGQSGTLGAALKGATAGLSGFSKLPSVLVQGLVQVGAAAAPAFKRLGAAASSGLGSLSQKMDAAFKSGAMRQAIEQAISLVKQLIQVAGNIASIFASVFQAAQVSGGGFVGMLQTITGHMRQAFASPEMQAGLRALFTTMAQLAHTAGPLLAQALGVVGQVLAKLGPPAQTLIRALGTALQPVIRALGPVLTQAAGAVGQLVVACAPLITAVGQIVAAILPALGPVFGAFSKIFAALAPIITQIASGISAYLSPVLSGLAQVIGQLISGYADQLVVILRSLAPLAPQIAAAMGAMGQAIGQVLVAVAPLLPAIMQLGTQLLASLLPAVIPLIQPLLRIATVMIQFAAVAIRQYAIPAIQGLIGFIRGLQAGFAPGIAAVRWLVNGISKPFEWLYDHLVGHSVIPDMVRGIVSWLAGLPGKAINALASLPGSLGRKAAEAARNFRSSIESGVSTAVGWLRGLPGRAISALGDLGGVLRGAGASLVGGLVRGIESAIGRVRSVLGRLTAMIPDWKGPRRRDASLLTPAGKSIIGGLVSGITASTSSLKSKLAQVTTLIERAIDINASNRRKRGGLSSLLSRVKKDNAALVSLAARRDAVAKRLSDATKKLNDLKAERNKAATEAANKALGEANIVTGHEQTNSVAAITVGLQQSLAKTQRFADTLAALKKKGVRGDILQQIADAGVAGGSATADALNRATPAELKRINDLQAKLTSAANKVGSTVADQMYGSGIRAAQGLVNGIKISQKAIEAQMIRIAKGMQGAIKKALGIRSPSKVFAEIGRQTGEGLRRGMLATTGAVAAASAAMAGAATGAARAATAVPAPGALAAAVPATGPTNNTFNLYSTDATPDGILRALSWAGLVGRR